MRIIEIITFVLYSKYLIDYYLGFRDFLYAVVISAILKDNLVLPSASI